MNYEQDKLTSVVYMNYISTKYFVPFVSLFL